jgi:hypothetical protein
LQVSINEARQAQFSAWKAAWKSDPA